MERESSLWEPNNTLMIGAWLRLLDAASTDMDVFWSSLERIVAVYGDPGFLTSDRGKLLFSLFGTMQEPVCRTRVQAQLKRRLFPNRITFNPGGDIYQTSLNQDRVARLHKAIEQVRAGFKMLTQIEDPLPGDTNEQATLVIYGSKADYTAYHPFLFDLSSRNGGIYIEKTGTLFTYDRTPSESIYTLEELVRHEYVHYIVARYLIHGSFRQTEFYRNDRLTWFDEGIAELLAGSDGQVVRLRVSIIKELTRDGTRRMTVKEIVTATYGDGFRFYRYAGALLAFLAKEKPETLNELVYSIRTDRVDDYDQIIARLAGDEPLEQNFQSNLDQVVQRHERPVNSPTIASSRLITREPLPEDKGCRAKLYDLARIETALQDILGGRAVSCELKDPKKVGQDPERFYYVGSVTCQSEDPQSLAMAAEVKGEMEKRYWFGYRGEAYGQRLTIWGGNSTPMCRAS